MFTGIVRERGRVAGDPAPSGQGGLRLRIDHGLELSARLEVGASLAVAGVCLTAVALTPGRTEVELSPETLARTRLGELRDGDEVNLEPALRLGEALGGHWVQGHVDGLVEVNAVEALGGHRVVWLSLPGDSAPYVVEKGSVTLDGVSLTVSALAADRFAVALVPHTLEVTTLGGVGPGDRLHLELDVLGKYVHRALQARGLA
jgi:riboflavin synthase alpha subunit